MTIQTDTRPVGSLQLGIQKYLYTGYFVAGCVVAYLVHNIVGQSWEGHEGAASLAGVVGGVLAVVAAWKNHRVRTFAQEVVDELAAVTWPSRQETYTATVVVIVTALTSSIVIFLLDRFWSWFTDLIFR